MNEVSNTHVSFLKSRDYIKFEHLGPFSRIEHRQQNDVKILLENRHHGPLQWCHMRALPTKVTENRLLFQQLVQANNNENIKGLQYRFFKSIGHLLISPQRTSNAERIPMSWREFGETMPQLIYQNMCMCVWKRFWFHITCLYFKYINLDGIMALTTLYLLETIYINNVQKMSNQYLQKSPNYLWLDPYGPNGTDYDVRSKERNGEDEVPSWPMTRDKNVKHLNLLLYISFMMTPWSSCVCVCDIVLKYRETPFKV